VHLFYKPAGMSSRVCVCLCVCVCVVLCEFLLCFSIFNGSKNCNKMDSNYTLIAYIGSLIISYFFPWFSILSGIYVSCGNLFMTYSPTHDNRTYSTSNKNKNKFEANYIFNVPLIILRIQMKNRYLTSFLLKPRCEQNKKKWLTW